MKKVAIAGATGMLGSIIYGILKNKYKLILICRNRNKIRQLEKVYGDSQEHKKLVFDFYKLYPGYLDGFSTKKDNLMLNRFIDSVGKIDAFINCAGIINKYANQNPLQTFFINSAIPFILSSLYQEKLIHVTTDCVFNGKKGAPYAENSIHTPLDLYGLSKSLGEPFKNSLVIRSSFIGPEIANFVSLLEWFKKQKRQIIPGYTNHIWNGITTRQFALICIQIIENRKKFPKSGLFHIFSTALSKYEILNKLKEKYKIEVTIRPVKTDSVNRRLTSIYNFCKTLNIPSFDKMLTDLN